MVAQTAKRLPTMRETQFDSWVGKIPWREKWQSTPALLPGKSHGPRSLIGYSPWGRKELDTTERLHFTSLHFNEHLIPNVRWILYRRREGILCASYQERLYERRRKSETSAFLSFPFNESSLILNFVTCSLNFSHY